MTAAPYPAPDRLVDEMTEAARARVRYEVYELLEFLGHDDMTAGELVAMRTIMRGAAERKFGAQRGPAKLVALLGNGAHCRASRPIDTFTFGHPGGLEALKRRETPYFF